MTPDESIAGATAQPPCDSEEMILRLRLIQMIVESLPDWAEEGAFVNAAAASLAGVGQGWSGVGARLHFASG